ncbi:Homeobox-leucine zipper protein ROC6 [Morus notabilis]|uniref:Homeobox-leucine zipper protein ROC6 n=1 Tax=Morus notabilis TaxID=981085 RepID=W9SDT9_9ROSA|nr:Homeobox-leucine zipper protein ROC6 [Morus notabilis]
MEVEIFSGDEFDQQLQAANSNSRKGKKKYHRHNAYQIQRLEAVFKEFPHPDENQRRELGRELGLDPKQVKFWFQNKRTQTKVYI